MRNRLSICFIPFFWSCPLCDHLFSITTSAITSDVFVVASVVFSSPSGSGGGSQAHNKQQWQQEAVASNTKDKREREGESLSLLSGGSAPSSSLGRFKWLLHFCHWPPGLFFFSFCPELLPAPVTRWKWGLCARRAHPGSPSNEVIVLPSTTTPTPTITLSFHLQSISARANQAEVNAAGAGRERYGNWTCSAGLLHSKPVGLHWCDYRSKKY